MSDVISLVVTLDVFVVFPVFVISYDIFQSCLD